MYCIGERKYKLVATMSFHQRYWTSQIRTGENNWVWQDSASEKMATVEEGNFLSSTTSVAAFFVDEQNTQTPIEVDLEQTPNSECDGGTGQGDAYILSSTKGADMNGKEGMARSEGGDERMGRSSSSLSGPSPQEKDGKHDHSRAVTCSVSPLTKKDA